MRRLCLFLALIGALELSTPSPLLAQESGETIRRVHAIAMHGEPLYGPDFTHFAYANPEAPKGGTIRLSAVGNFDSFNPFILKGVAAANIGSLYESLTVGSADEAFTQYGLIAESMEMPEDRSWIVFNLRPEARWHDGQPITAEDVVFSFNILMEQGHPAYRFYYRDVVAVEALAERRVKFAFANAQNRELALSVGQLQILPKHWWEGRAFDKPSLEPPLGSGPYRLKSFEAGRNVVYERVADYWGADLPVRRGSSNWDEMRFEYFRDETVMLEGFKAGEFDLHRESIAKVWATGYDIPQVADGRIVKEEIPNEDPNGMQAFIFNIRRPIFADARVREAINLAFDFEWSNKALFYGQYTRSESFFSNTELAASGLPSPEELVLLEPWRGQVPEQVFTTAFRTQRTNGSGNNRENLLKAAALLKEAGWVVQDNRLIDPASGQPFAFEILLYRSTFERVFQPFVQNLRRLGIAARIRTVDVSQYKNRLDNFDFDMIVDGFGQSLSPGNEQYDMWGSAVAEVPGSANSIGIKNPAIDALIANLIAAPDRDALIVATRALDRVLLWNWYVIPNWHSRTYRVVYWNKFSRPALSPKYGFGLAYWWVDPTKEEALAAGLQDAPTQ